MSGEYEEYHPYGSIAWWLFDSSRGVSETRYKYTGMERDEETSLQLHGVRMYSPWVGRWTSVDPSRMNDGANSYEYCRANPSSRFDVTGRASLSDWMNDPLDALKSANAELVRASPTFAKAEGYASRALDATGTRGLATAAVPGLLAGAVHTVATGAELVETLSPTDPTRHPEKHATSTLLNKVGDQLHDYAASNERDLQAAGRLPTTAVGSRVDQAEMLGGATLLTSIGAAPELGEVLSGGSAVIPDVGPSFGTPEQLGARLPKPIELTISPRGAITAEDGVEVPSLMDDVSSTLSPQKQARHVLGTRAYAARGGSGSYFLREGDAQAVLDAAHGGTVRFFGTTDQGHVVVGTRSVTGFNNNPGAGFVDQPTNVFLIKGTASPSVVPTTPTWWTE